MIFASRLSFASDSSRRAISSWVNVVLSNISVIALCSSLDAYLLWNPFRSPVLLSVISWIRAILMTLLTSHHFSFFANIHAIRITLNVCSVTFAIGASPEILPNLLTYFNDPISNKNSISLFMRSRGVVTYYKYYVLHIYISRFRAFLRTNDTAFFEDVHDSCGTSKSYSKFTLEESGRGFSCL